MPKALRSAVCLFVALLLLSGCGSSKTASTTNTASTSAGASATTQTASQQSAGSTQAQHASKTREPKAAKAKSGKAAPEAKPERKETRAEEEAYRRRVRVRKARERAAATPGLAFAEAQLPRKRRYPKELQGKFMVACRAAKGSTSSCECIVAKQELNRKIELGQGLAELLAVELAFQQQGASLEDVRRHRVKTPRGVRLVSRECRHA